MNRHCRKDSGHKCGQHIPEELLHGYILLSENVPTSGNLSVLIPEIKPGSCRAFFTLCRADSACHTA